MRQVPVVFPGNHVVMLHHIARQTVVSSNLVTPGGPWGVVVPAPIEQCLKALREACDEANGKESWDA